MSARARARACMHACCESVQACAWFVSVCARACACRRARLLVLAVRQCKSVHGLDYVCACLGLNVRVQEVCASARFVCVCVCACACMRTRLSVCAVGLRKRAPGL
jgi:hypothetical protein